MNCPRCGLLSPPSSSTCKCGYDFERHAVTGASKGGRSGSWTSRFWPVISDEATARSAARQGFWAAVLCAAATALFAVLAEFGYLPQLGLNIWSMLDAACFGAIAFGIWKFSRFAAFAGLFLYVGERIIMWMDLGVRNPAIAIVFTVCFVNSVRGARWLHSNRRLSQQLDATALSGCNK